MQACFWSDWAIFHSTVESSVSNEVKDFLSVPYFPPGTAAKRSKSQGSDNLKLNMLWVSPSLKKVNGVKTLSAWQGHYLWSVLLLLNHLLSPQKGSMWLYFHAQHQLKERTIGQRIYAEQCHDVLILKVNSGAASHAVLRCPTSVSLQPRAAVLGGSWTCVLIWMQIP